MDIETHLVNRLVPTNKSELKVGDKVNALVFPSVEVNGIIKKIDGHMVLIEIRQIIQDDPEYKLGSHSWTPKVMCTKI
jgi:hypothetical protein